MRCYQPTTERQINASLEMRTGIMVGLTTSKAGATEKLGCTAPAASAATLAEVVELPLPLLLPEAEPLPFSPAAEVVAPVDDAEEPGVVMLLLLPPDEAAYAVVMSLDMMVRRCEWQFCRSGRFALDNSDMQSRTSWPPGLHKLKQQLHTHLCSVLTLPTQRAAR